MASPPDPVSTKAFDADAEHVEVDGDVKRTIVDAIHHPDPELYAEALAKYPNDEAIDRAEEKRLVRRLDFRILPLLGICYFFYVRLAPLCVLHSCMMPAFSRC